MKVIYDGFGWVGSFPTVLIYLLEPAAANSAAANSAAARMGTL